MASSPLNFIDVFSGAGGLSCGLEMAGLKCLLGIEKMSQAFRTFAINHQHAAIYPQDVTLLTKKRLFELIQDRPIDVVVGGPPCQGFTTVGHGNPDDKRNQLFLEFIRIVKAVHPKFIVIENVTGLLAKKNEDTLNSIFNCIEKLGYRLDVQVLCAQHYGVAEVRRRTIMIGTNLNVDISFPRPTHDILKANTYRPPITVGDVLEDIADSNGNIYNHDLHSASQIPEIDKKRLHKIPEGCGIRYKKDEINYLPPSLRLGVDWTKLKEGRFRQTRYFKLDRKKPGPTIMSTRHYYHHPTRPRLLTQREAARIQSFPNDFLFCGSVSSQWEQIGNAVPPLLGKAIGNTIKKMDRTARKSISKVKFFKKRNIDGLRGQAFVYKT